MSIVIIQVPEKILTYCKIKCAKGDKSNLIKSYGVRGNDVSLFFNAGQGRKEIIDMIYAYFRGKK